MQVDFNELPSRVTWSIARDVSGDGDENGGGGGGGGGEVHAAEGVSGALEDGSIAGGRGGRGASHGSDVLHHQHQHQHHHQHQHQHQHRHTHEGDVLKRMDIYGCN